MPYEYREYYRRKLPHIHHPGATLFVTFRLVDSVPKSVIQEWRQEREWLKAKENAATNKEARAQFHRRWFKRNEDILHACASGATWLANDEIAQVVADSLQFGQGKWYELHAYCIMPNHVHAVFTPKLGLQNLQGKMTSQGLRFESDIPDLTAIMRSVKGYSGNKANKILKRHGEFWESESYDHWIRDEAEFYRIIRYVLENPVKAGLVQHWKEWKWKFINETLANVLVETEEKRADRNVRHT